MTELGAGEAGDGIEYGLDALVAHYVACPATITYPSAIDDGDHAPSPSTVTVAPSAGHESAPKSFAAFLLAALIALSLALAVSDGAYPVSVAPP